VKLIFQFKVSLMLEDSCKAVVIDLSLPMSPISVLLVLRLALVLLRYCCVLFIAFG